MSTITTRPESAAINPRQLRNSLGRFATGVAVIVFDALGDDGWEERRGLTVNSFTSVSMDPPLVLVSLQRTLRSHDLLRGRPFSINILGADQREVAMHFAGRPGEPRVVPHWVPGEFAPGLADALATFECLPWAEYDGGDHTLFLGEVQRVSSRPGDALGFAFGAFTTIPEPTA
ncbi:MAG TPA: flavin reductase family protein [Microbacteriaceae bacterium]|nr:flavin reductase family protein [Microbacteriaceae bacterium]